MVEEHASDGAKHYTVRLTGAPTGLVTVTATSNNAAVTLDADLTPLARTLTFNVVNWATAQAITATAVADHNATSESAVVSHTVVGYGTVTMGPNVDVLVTDNDAPSLHVAPTALALVEEGPSGAYAVRLNTLPTGDVVVTVGGATAAVSADADGDAPGVQTAMTFTTSTWSTAQTVTVSAPTDDDATNATTTLTHAVTGPGGYANLAPAARPGVQVTVTDDDARRILVDADPATPNDLDGGPLALVENGSKQYTVRLSTRPTGAVTVTATSAAATLAVDNDGSPQTRTLTFSTSTWDAAQTVTARALDDLDGGDETTTIAHAAMGGDYGSVSAALAAAVADDDQREVVAASPIALDEGGMATSTARLSTQPTGTVTVAIADDHPDVTVEPPTLLTFDAATWRTAQTFTISAREDFDGEDETATLTLDPRGADYDGAPSATSTVNLADDDPRGVTLSESTLAVPEGSSAHYTVRLDTQPAGGSVTVTVGGVPADGISASPTALTFTGTTWDTARTVRVSAAEDDNPTHESVTLTHAASGADYEREGVTAGSVRATATDNDTPSLRVAPTALALVEEGASGVYAVRLNTLPTGDVVVTVGGATAAVSADADGDAPGVQTAMTFTTSTWSTAQTVTVSAPADDDATNATTTLTHAASGPGDYGSLVPAARPGVQVTVTDDDARRILVDADPATPNDLDGGPLALVENGSKQYTVRLSTLPTGTVTVTATSAAATLAVDNDGSPQTRTLTFSTSTWDAAQTVTARALDDLDGGDETTTIAHAAMGGDYGSVSAALAAAVADDDQREVVAASPIALDEGGMATSTARLSTQPTGTVTVAIADDHPDVTVEPPTLLTFDAATWRTAQTFTISAREDFDGEDETATLTLDPRGADYDGAPSATSTVNLADDDPRGVTLSESTLAVPEGSSAHYTVRLDTQPAGGSVTVTVGGVPADGISASPTALTFTGTTWDTARTVRVSAAEDDNPTHESVDLTHAVSGADYGREGVAAGSVRATATDNDTPSLRVAPTALALVEEGASGVYAVRLNTLPTGDVVVTVGGATAAVSADADGDAPGVQTAMTFTTSTWSTAQTVTVSAPADDDATNATTTTRRAS